jgi:hypothetical protein
MPEPQQTDSPENPKTSRSFSARAERSLKECDRLLRGNSDSRPQQRAMAQFEHAKILALLQVAEAIRQSRKR